MQSPAMSRQSTRPMCPSKQTGSHTSSTRTHSPCRLRRIPTFLMRARTSRTRTAASGSGPASCLARQSEDQLVQEQHASLGRDEVSVIPDEQPALDVWLLSTVL